MALYTVRVLDKLDGRIVSRQVVCATEGEAVGEMLAIAGEKAAELWRGERKILWWPGRVTPSGRNARKAPPHGFAIGAPRSLTQA